MKTRKGLTLIEIIISIAIISLLAVAILGMFNFSIVNIIKSGKRTERVVKVKELIDMEINNSIDNGIYEVDVTLPGDINKTILGTMIEKQSPDDPKIKINTFVPNTNLP